MGSDKHADRQTERDNRDVWTAYNYLPCINHVYTYHVSTMYCVAGGRFS